MATHREVEQMIRFALDQLGVRNRQHEFEHVCRKFARLRICENILPATGPVSAGGDQGRDFETYVTHLSEHLDAGTWFVGATADGPVAFACSIQREKVSTKIRSDVTSICSHGTRPVSIHFFSVMPVPVSARHKLQAWARKAWDVALEIHDAEALAEQLTDPRLFWIASEYLDIPLTLYPDTLAEDREYVEARERWSRREDRVCNHASFIELRSLARSLLENPLRRPDLGLWLEALEGFFREQPSPLFLLKERARYEYLVLRLRVSGDLLGQEDTVRAALLDATTTDYWPIIYDAAPLTSYALGAVARGALRLPFDEVREFRDRIAYRIEALLEDDRSSAERCWLMATRGFLSFQPDRPEQAGAGAFSWWNRVLDLAPDAPLYPVSRISDYLTGMAVMFAGADGYDELVRRADELVGQREGNFVQAQKCLERGIKLREAGKRVEAIRELNRGKMFAFSEERIFQLAGAMLLVANIYEDLGCTYASKYYALAVLHVCLRHSATEPKLVQLIRPAVVACAQADYINGSFSQCLDYLELGFRAEDMYVAEDQGVDDLDYERLRLYAAYVLAASAQQPDVVRQAIRQRMSLWPARDVIYALEADVAEVLATEPRGVQDGKPVFCRPLFTDLERTQEIVWSGLGVTWRIQWDTSPRATLAAEQLSAVLQIVTVDLSRWDLYSLPTECRVRIVLDDRIAESSLVRSPDNNASVWTLTIPNIDAAMPEERHVRDVAHVVTMLHDLSLRPKLFEWIDRAYRDGLAGNTFVVDTYGALVTALVDVEAWTRPIGRAVPVAGPHPVRPELAWNASLIEEYDKAQAETLLQGRYETGYRVLRASLPVWLRDAGGSAIVASLRGRGWLDWQILGGVAALVANERVNQVCDRRTPEGQARGQEMMQRLMSVDETTPLPSVTLGSFDESTVEMAMKFNAISTLRGMGLEPRQRTPSFEAVLEFLRRKVRFFDDDIEHEDVFNVLR
jgi:hypothetical protein